MNFVCCHSEVEAGMVCPHCNEQVHYMLGKGTRKVTQSEARQLGADAANELRKMLKDSPEFFAPSPLIQPPKPCEHEYVKDDEHNIRICSRCRLIEGMKIMYAY